MCALRRSEAGFRVLGSFRVGRGRETYVVYANTGSVKCFEGGDIGRKRMACPHKGPD